MTNFTGSPVKGWQLNFDVEAKSVPDWVIQGFFNGTLRLVGEEQLAVVVIVSGDTCIRTINVGDWVIFLSSGLFDTATDEQWSKIKRTLSGSSGAEQSADNR